MLHRAAPIAVAAVALTAGGCGNDNNAAPAAGSSQEQARATGATSNAQQVARGRIDVSMTEFRFRPKAMSAKAGKLRVTASNDGRAPHEFVVIKTSKAPGKLPVRGPQASEAGAVGEIPEQKPGRSASHTFRLKSGRYVYICNVPGHYKAGMYGTLTVR